MWRRLGIARACWLGPDVTAVAFHTTKKPQSYVPSRACSPEIFIDSDAVQFIAPACDENPS